MSTSQNVFLWKQKAKIDYIPLFVSLWLALDAWMSDRFVDRTERDRLESLKHDGHPLYERFSGLMQAGDATSTTFKASLSELHRALADARIPYPYDSEQFSGKTIRFNECILDWNNGRPHFGTILRMPNEEYSSSVDVDLWFDDNIGLVYAVYMEIVYQIRCSLFHGRLPPTTGNERVIQHVYMTLSIIMERI